ncbi:BURP domain-containing protein 5-like [Spinacia oleracea]|uniref:BURP domain-containing protein 5-like n=1 Tax=Spinacia oleracea TaxID=3562 RepID=A0ABM3QZM3_SPIOL|nr:BURP domain-containing protein 5-like [Spinacia oleracea]
MIDYVNPQFQPSVLDLNVLSMEVSRRIQFKSQITFSGYRVRGVKSVGNVRKIVSCHKAAFPLSVFMCHRLQGRAYHVKLQSPDKDGGKVEALLSCHHDASNWSPRYGGFKILTIAPGKIVCHLLLKDNVIFIKLN